MLSIGVDVGGTFTDLFLHDSSTGQWRIGKVPSTPPDFVDGFLAGLRSILDAHGAEVGDVEHLFHGTTVATNALLTRRGARLGLLMTAGFEDTLVIGRGKRLRQYDLFMDAVEPLFLLPRRRCRPVPERVDASGEVVVPLDEASVISAVDELVETYDVDAIVVSYLHSYANPAHERRTEELIAERHPGLAVTISSAVLPKRREYQRLIAACFDAYLRPVVRDYVGTLVKTLEDEGVDTPLQMMQSTGGLAGAWTVLETPLKTVLSGLAAGVIAGARAGAESGYPNCVTLDMGGTSADVALIRDGRPEITTEASLDGYPLSIPMVDVRTIGSGGSSIAWIDDGGAMKVGPGSAGAMPGPACYGRGGQDPTVTDASLLLGYLDPASFAGGLELDPDLSRKAIAEKIAQPLGLSVEEAALGIHTVVNFNMARLLQLVSIERGADPRELALIAFGGAGPVHAVRLIEELSIPTVVVPPTPGVCSALGLLYSNMEHEFGRSYHRPAGDASPDDMGEILQELDSICAARLDRDSAATEGRTMLHFAELRYQGQTWELEVPLSSPVDQSAIGAAVDAFHALHRQIYGYARAEAPVEFVSLRAVHTARAGSTPDIGEAPDPSSTTPEIRRRLACFDLERGYEEVNVLTRAQLPAGYRVEGPAIIEQPDSTTLVDPGQSAQVTDNGYLLIHQEV